MDESLFFVNKNVEVFYMAAAVGVYLRSVFFGIQKAEES